MLADMKGYHSQLMFYGAALPLSERSKFAMRRRYLACSLDGSTPLSVNGYLLAVGGHG